MDMAPQILVAGAITEAIYALVALGLIIGYNATGIVNFAHGEFVMMGGVLSGVAILSFQLNPAVAVPLGMLLVAASPS